MKKLLLILLLIAGVIWYLSSRSDIADAAEEALSQGPLADLPPEDMTSDMALEELAQGSGSEEGSEYDGTGVIL